MYHTRQQKNTQKWAHDARRAATPRYQKVSHWRYSSHLTEMRLPHPSFRILCLKSSTCEPFKGKVHIWGVSPFPGKVQQSLHNIPWQGQTSSGRWTSWACPSPQMGPLCLGELKIPEGCPAPGMGTVQTARHKPEIQIVGFGSAV